MGTDYRSIRAGCIHQIHVYDFEHWKTVCPFGLMRGVKRSPPGWLSCCYWGCALAWEVLPKKMAYSTCHLSGRGLLHQQPRAFVHRLKFLSLDESPGMKMLEQRSRPKSPGYVETRRLLMPVCFMFLKSGHGLTPAVSQVELRKEGLFLQVCQK